MNLRSGHMFKIEDIISGEVSGYPEEIQEFIKEYTKKLKENMKSAMINDVAKRMLMDIEKTKHNFMDILTDILSNGCKGLNEMSTKELLNVYLENRDEEQFISLLEKTNKDF
jgi:UDP-galactopyranose mutase